MINALGSDLDSIVDAFEAARAASSGVRIEECAPPSDHPHYREIVAELLRVDLEWQWERGDRPTLESYRQRFGDVLSEPLWLERLAYEEYRQRCAAGEATSPAEYLQAYGIDVAHWPLPSGVKSNHSPVSASVNSDGVDAATGFPQAGESFLSFELVEEIGRGAFGRVYLARQTALACRLVALKVSRGASVEPDRLARLQHTNVVPIYSVHQSHGMEVVCMPYLGRSTLADVVAYTRRQGRLPQSGQELLTTIIGRQSETIGQLPQQNMEAARGLEQQPSSELAPSIRERLEQSSYVDAVVWIAAQICAGLAHAHERGILHRDLKPANVLLADDGRPMLLDFNLADQLGPQKSRAAAVGGTAPYMAPEHLDAMESGVGIDARCDIYSLGVMMFELLTGRLPFEAPAVITRESLAIQIAGRRRGAPAVRSVNRLAPRSVDAVVARCLAPEPSQRYQTVEQLRCDLERHLASLPLLHATDRSPKERVTKWMRRHPRLSSASSMGVVGVIALASILVGTVARDRQYARMGALQQLAAFLAGAAEARIPLSIPEADVETLDAGIAAADAQLARYSVLDSGDWRSGDAYQLLPAESQRELSRAIETTVILREAAVSRRNGEAAPAAPSAVADGELRIVELIQQGRYGDALPMVTKWRDKSPTDLSAWMLLGVASAGIGNHLDAEECFTTCTRLRPKYPLSYFQRGLARYALQKYREAATDFSKHIELEGPSVASLVNRALARHAVGEEETALDDLDAALAAGAAQTRIYFIRAEIRRRLGNEKGAAEDYQRGLESPPQDAKSYLARGMALLKSDPHAALSDFRKALELEPGSRLARQNIIHVLGDKLGKEDEALVMLDELLSANPNDARALASRAVIKARKGERQAAVEDILVALQLDDGPPMLLQAACTFASFAAENDADRTKALQLTARAIGAKPELAAVAAIDPDLEPLRSSEEFQRVLEASEIIRTGGTAPKD
jgi:serine/threonine protein kinase/tetratricopeptide (TPR) repeat protein